VSINTPDRDMHVRPGLGAAAHVMQGRELEILRIRVEQPMLIFIDKGTKTVRCGDSPSVQAFPGQAILLAGGHTVDFNNGVLEDGEPYEARCLVVDPALLEDAYYASRVAMTDAAAPGPAQLLRQPSPDLAAAFESASRALALTSAVPDAVVRQRLLEVMHWLLEAGIALHRPQVDPRISLKVRSLIVRRLDHNWTATSVAGQLALSEATLRRRLAEESTSFSELLVDTRMATALTLLQATTHPVSEIALSVGYESSSRFAVRFRQRFGFSPTTVRGKRLC